METDSVTESVLKTVFEEPEINNIRSRKQKARESGESNHWKQIQQAEIQAMRQETSSTIVPAVCKNGNYSIQEIPEESVGIRGKERLMKSNRFSMESFPEMAAKVRSAGSQSRSCSGYRTR